MLTIIIPAYNEELAINSTLQELTILTTKNEWNIIVVNDGSTDKTREIVEKYDEVRLINHPYNKGYGASLKTGIKSAETDIVAIYDSDGQHTPEDLEKLYENYQSYDMIIGERQKESHQEWLRKPGKFLLSKIANFLTGVKIPDLNSGLRIINRDIIIKILHLFPDGFSFSTTSTIAFLNLGYNVKYIPILTRKRIGKSTVKQLKHGSSVLLLILRLIVLFNPLKVFIPTSIFLFVLGLIYEIIYGIIMIPNEVRFIQGALFIMIASVIIFFFGILVEQISELRKQNIDENT